jgi:cytochrome c oxidase subunit IV
MSGFSNYEADQSALYSGGHHEDRNSPQSKALVKKIWKVTAILSLVTIVEVGLGLWCFKSTVFPKGVANIFFILLTIFKAGYIVKVFMHLGDELKNMILTILIPLTLFIWFIIAFLFEGGFWLQMNQAVDKF